MKDELQYARNTLPNARVASSTDDGWSIYTCPGKFTVQLSRADDDAKTSDGIYTVLDDRRRTPRREEFDVLENALEYAQKIIDGEHDPGRPLVVATQHDFTDFADYDEERIAREVHYRPAADFIRVHAVPVHLWVQGRHFVEDSNGEITEGQYYCSITDRGTYISEVINTNTADTSAEIQILHRYHWEWEHGDVRELNRQERIQRMELEYTSFVEEDGNIVNQVFPIRRSAENPDD